MGPLENTMSSRSVIQGVQRDIQTPPVGDGSGKIKDMRSAIGYYEGFAHGAKYIHNVYSGKASGLSAEEFKECRSRLQELLNSPSPEVQEYARQELGKLNGYILDKDATADREASISDAQRKYDSALEAYNAGKPSWFAKTFKGAQIDPELQKRLDYATKELELEKGNVVSYETILKHNG